MPFSGSGTFTVDEPAFVPGTVISSTATNNNNTDFADGLTNAITKDGQSTPSAVIPLNTLGFNYATDSNTGMYRYAADTQRIKAGGTDIVEISTSGLKVLSGVGGLPVGLGPLPWPTASAPTGWLLCYGQPISRSTYALLFAVIGTTFGAGDTATTFNVPDLRGRIPAGKDDMGGSAASRLTTAGSGVDGATLGAVGGSQNEVILQANLPSEILTVNISSGQGSHQHTMESTSQAANSNNTGGLALGQGIFYRNAAPDGILNTNTITAATLPALTGTADLGGSDTALITVQPTIVTNYIIYAGA